MRKVMQTVRGLLRGQRGITGLETAIVLIAFVVVSSTFAFAALTTGLFSADKSKETINKGLEEALGTLEVTGSIWAATTSATSTNEAVGTGDGSAVRFALDNPRVIRGSATVTVGGTAQTEGADYTISYENADDGTNGGLLFGTAPANAAAVVATYTYYTVNDVFFYVSNSAGGGVVDLTPGTTIISYMDDDTIDLDFSGFTASGVGDADSDNLVEMNETFKITVPVDGDGVGADLYAGKAFQLELKPTQGAVVNISRMIPFDIENIIELN